MARARNIKPGFFMNEDLAETSFETRLLFIGLWTIADREGRLEDRPKRIKAGLFPFDSVNVDSMLTVLERLGFIQRYAAGGQAFIQIANFTKHQMPHHKEAASEIPPPAGQPAITRHAYDVSKELRAVVFQRDGMHCLKCGSEEGLTIDHVVPLARGGNNDVENLQTLCYRCNSAKGDAVKSYRTGVDVVESPRGRSNVESTLNQARTNDGASCPSDSLIPSSLIPDSRDSDADAPPSSGAKPNPKPKKLEPVSVDELVAAGIDEPTAVEFIAHKASVKAPLTARAWADHLAESGKAGWTPKQAAEKVMAKSWKGFEAKYVADERPQARGSPTKEDRKKAEMRAWFGSAFQTPPEDDDAVTFALR